MKVVSLGSGSSGNAYYVAASGSALLIDCGLNGCTLKARAEAVGVSLAAVEAVLVTHEHGDHVSGLPVFHKRYPEVPFYANVMTADAVMRKGDLKDDDFVCFENEQSFEIGPFEVEPFSIPHDVCDPVGYLIRAENTTYFHATDVGSPLASIGRKLSLADVATLESDYDCVMLKTSGRAPQLIERIRGPRGHLSNDDACELVQNFASPRLKRLNLGHLSGECNAPHLVERAMRETLMNLGRADVTFEVLPRDASGTVWSSEGE